VFDRHNLFDLASPRSLGCGELWSVAGAGDGTVALGTAAGILLAKVTSGGNSIVGRIPFISSHVELSAAGDLLVASATTKYYQYLPDRSVKIFALPSGVETKAWPYTLGIADFSLARGGTRLGHTVGTFGSFDRSVTDLNGTLVEFSDTVAGFDPQYPPPRVHLSPDGSHAAVVDGPSGSNTRIYSKSTLVGAVTGSPRVWLDNDRLLTTDKIVDATGATVGSGQLPVGWSTPATFTAVTSTRVYSPEQNSIYDFATQSVVWSGPLNQTGSDYNTLGAVAGGFVVYRKGSAMTAEAY
jgi:hypothetical protein